MKKKSKHILTNWKKKNKKIIENRKKTENEKSKKSKSILKKGINHIHGFKKKTNKNNNDSIYEKNFKTIFILNYITKYITCTPYNLNMNTF